MIRIRRSAVLAVFAISLHSPFVSGIEPGIDKALKGPLKGSLAVQLWSFRNDLGKDVPGTLKRVRDLGFTYVELAGFYGMTATQFRAELDKAGLKAISMHVEYEAARDRLDEVVGDAKVLGVQAVGVPWIATPFTRADCLRAIAVFNHAGRKLAANGLRFFYHLHGYEFVPNEAGRGTLFDLLLKKTNPRFVGIQLDTFHAVYPGQDPVKLLRKYRGRFLSLHLKDIRKDVVGDQSGDYKEVDEKPIGQGKINWPDVFRAARKAGVRWYIVEDETTGVWATIPESLRYLESIKF